MQNPARVLLASGPGAEEHAAAAQLADARRQADRVAVFTTHDAGVAWLSPYRQSRAVIIEQGHGRKAHVHPGYGNLAANAMRWSAAPKQRDVWKYSLSGKTLRQTAAGCGRLAGTYAKAVPPDKPLACWRGDEFRNDQRRPSDQPRATLARGSMRANVAQLRGRHSVVSAGAYRLAFALRMQAGNAWYSALLAGASPFGGSR